MLRLLIGTGALLMLVGFGAAGWQYWQGMPLPQDGATAPAEAAGLEPETEVWLLTATGGIVPETDGRAFLVQDRLVRERMLRVSTTAALGGLLLAGEKLPAAPYLEVLADIRAPRLAQALCPIVTQSLARTCMVDKARVVAGSVDILRGEARFEIALAYRQKVEGVELPDLAAHVLRFETIRPDPALYPASASVEAALAGVVAAALAACGAEDRAPTCRVLELTLDWPPGAVRRTEARIAWLAPLPEGMFTAPPIVPLPEG